MLQAFLQRVVNGGGRIDREYSLGSGRTDLLLVFPFGDEGIQRIVLELKIRKGTRQTTIEKALPQITDYMDRVGADEGHVVIFDQTSNRWEEKIFNQQASYEGKVLEIWGM